MRASILQIKTLLIRKVAMAYESHSIPEHFWGNNDELCNEVLLVCVLLVSDHVIIIKAKQVIKT